MSAVYSDNFVHTNKFTKLNFSNVTTYCVRVEAKF